MMPFYILVFIIPLNNLTLPMAAAHFPFCFLCWDKLFKSMDTECFSSFNICIRSPISQYSQLACSYYWCQSSRAQGYKFQYIQFYKWNRPFVRKCFHGYSVGYSVFLLRRTWQLHSCDGNISAFVIPSVFAYYKVSENSKRDITKMKSILRKRAKNMP